MFTKLIIGLAAFLTVAGTASAMEWQPSWAPVPIELVPGQTYRTGSPLSRPGLFGLLGGILDSAAPGFLESQTGVRMTGGGYEVWTGSAANLPDKMTVNGVEVNTLSMREAAAVIAPTSTENKPRLGDGTRADCGYTFAKAVEMDSAYDWCAGEKIEYARLGVSCEAGQQVWVTLVSDEELGVRSVYSCRGK